jgi:hypothetical protein
MWRESLSWTDLGKASQMRREQPEESAPA